ncbi:MAG: double-strand break repair protein AddB, partial [Dongiaceae bacterium]
MAGVYTIPAEDDFFRELAIALWQEVKAPEELSRYLLLLPTRHNARDLQEIFLELAGGNPVLPPCIIPLSEGEENDLRFYEEAELAIPPAIDRLSRQWQLAALIGAQRRHSGAPPLSLAVMLDLAYDLGGLLDQLEQQGATLGDIQKLVPEDLAEHWQRTVDFLNLLQTAWPEKLKAQNLLNPAERHNRLLRSQAASWAENPPSFPIIAAGAMGLEPAIADMLAVIAKLPTGRVVLPGLDQGMDQESWEAVGPLHPHYALKNLLQRLEIGRDKVKPWAGKKPASARAILWREVMRPAEVSDGWQRLKDKVEFTGLQLLECATPEEEAALIALLMREEREKNESATAALVTANRDLALRVIAQLKRWGIDVEDGAGQNFAATPLGQFLAGTSLLFAGEIEIADVLSVLKHPLCRMGRPKGAVAAIAQNMEKEVLRIKGAPKTLDLLLEDASLAEDQRRLLSQLLEWRGALAERYSLAAMVKRHLDFVTKLAATDQAPGGQILWLGSAGEAASEFFTKLPDERSLDQKIDAEDYAAVLPLLWQRLNLREPLSPNRLFVWGLAEARLKRARRMILGGLNENSWPDAPDSGPWLNRAMRKKTGLPDIDCKIGLAAHDFIMAAQGNEVFLTRSLREGGRPAAPSRWLQRLKAVAKAAGAEQELQQESGKYFSWLRQLDEAPLNPRPSPMPKPPLAARPKKLSVSEIELWMRDPYALYARKILNIKPLP